MTDILHIVLAMKPTDGNFSENAIRHGVAGINIDGCRVGMDAMTSGGSLRDIRGGSYGRSDGRKRIQTPTETTQGRWPANVILGHSEGCRCVGAKQVKGITGGKESGGNAFGQDSGWNKHDNKLTEINRQFGSDGKETVEDWECVDGCPVRAINEQSGDLKSGFMKADTTRTCDGGYHGGFPLDRVGERDTYGDKGTAARFFKQVGELKGDIYDRDDEA